MEFITVDGRTFSVDFDYSDDGDGGRTTVQTDAPCPACKDVPTKWIYTQLCEAGYPGAVCCGDCDELVRLESK